jgi:hypothetical protein
VAGCCPRHPSAPGAQTPVQAPFTHVCAVQATALPHEPLAWQVCTPLPRHCVCLGAHSPVHVAFKQVSFVHGAGVSHCPLVPHVSMLVASAEHSLVPGVHGPEQVPWLHAEPVAQALPHAPQLLEDVLVSVSHPLETFLSQSAQPGLHWMMHADVEQAPIPLALLHTSPQLPQFLGSTVVLTSQPLAEL